MKKKLAVTKKAVVITSALTLMISLFPMNNPGSVAHASGIESSTSYSNSNNGFDNLKVNQSTDKVFDEMDLLKKMEETPSVHEMTKEQKAGFDELVEEEVSKHGGDNPELYRQILTDFFDTTSGHANDIVFASQKLESGSLDFVAQPIFGAQEVGAMGFWDWVPDIKIGVNLAGSILNVAIGAAVGGGVGGIQAYIRSKGVRAAEQMFGRTVKTKLTEWGAPKLAIFVGAAVSVAMEYSDVGGKIAEYIESKDSKPKNGWIDIYVGK